MHHTLKEGNMRKEEASYILHELKSIRYYRIKINELNKELKDVADKIVDVQTPKSPTGNTGTSTNRKDKASIVNALLTDEQELIRVKNYYEISLSMAIQYLDNIKKICECSEWQFVSDFINVKNTNEYLIRKHYYRNPWKKMISLIIKAESKNN